MAYAIGVDLGGTKCSVVLGRETDGALEILQRRRFPTGKDTAPADTLQQIEQAVRSFGDVEAQGIGISCGGPLDPSAGVILAPPNLPLWDSVPIAGLLSRSTGLPARLQNDADACALAEWRFGAGKGTRHMIFLTFGTGMGAGLILNGRLYSGCCGMGGEIGHVRMEEYGPSGYGKAGSFEGFCSGAGIGQMGYTMGLEAVQKGRKPLYFDRHTGPDGCTALSIAQAAEEGDETARLVYKRCGDYLGRGLALLMDLLNPECVVLGSIFVRAAKWLWPAAEQMIAREALPASRAACRVLPAALGEELGDYAALATAFYKGEEDR